MPSVNERSPVELAGKARYTATIGRGARHSSAVDMRSGQPQVDLTALSDLKRLVTPTAARTHSPSENGVAREEVDEAAQRACADLGQADEPLCSSPARWTG